jgi:hypothetical protein
MGWWKIRGGLVLGDSAADYVELWLRMGLVVSDPSQFPTVVREGIDTLYVEGIGRRPTDEELEALLEFSR